MYTRMLVSYKTVLQASAGDNPKAAAVREQLRKRLSEQEEKERATKTELVQKAANYLEQFYEVCLLTYTASAPCGCKLLLHTTSCIL